MYCRLSSQHYRRPPLVQGGLEIECEVVIDSRATMLQSKLTARYLDLVKDIYTEPTEDRAVGNLFNFIMTLPPVINTRVPVKRKKSYQSMLQEIETSEKCLEHIKEEKNTKNNCNR